MINKKNLLGKTPDELGSKDAIHTAIVAVRAATSMEPGTRCKINKYNEAEPDSKGVGVADPFLKNTIIRGRPFWLLLAQDEVPNVRHVWEHPTVDFSPPTRDVELNYSIKSAAELFGVTYDEVMKAANSLVYKEKSLPYTGKMTEEQFEEACDNFDRWDFWSEWASETLYEFENQGSVCCPEYNYPEDSLFEFKRTNE
jgi:hypothetical protein